MSNLISRQAAIDALDKRFDSIPMEQTVEVLQLRRDLRELPSAESEPMCINLNEPIKVKLTDWGKPIGDGRPLADCEVIPRLQDIKRQIGGSYAIERAIEVLEELPFAEPEIIHCKDCRKHNVNVGFDEDGHTVWKEDACPLVSWRGKAKGHEFDYQHCSCAELRGEEE